ncbi:MAG: flagellar protein export ATPase FliI [Alphaproteobacteria bacterium]|nr:flagellar protein export ATPase FliI [Alphaproteobacteria bacterium]
MHALMSAVAEAPRSRSYGRVTGVQGLLVEVAGTVDALAVGTRLAIEGPRGSQIGAEVVGFRAGRALTMPFGELDGVKMGCKAYVEAEVAEVHPSNRWLGRVINALGQPVDGKGALPVGGRPYRIRAAPPPAHARARVGGKLDLGVKALNTFTTTCQGQRLGIFAASGVGKSVLLSMIARYTSADVIVIGLVGERGREVQEFLEDDLGPEGLARSVVVVATSDESALMRRQAAYLTLTTAEYFRDQGLQVLCLMDSVTRFAMAQREIGLASGEPPASKGYTPSVFAELPRLLERAGPGLQGSGTITGLFTVLVEGDDHDEPVSDAVRGILDGHIVLERAIGERGRYPAVNVLRSLSRTMPQCNSPEEQVLVDEARRVLATYENMAELIRLGAYRAGADPEVDRAIRLYPSLEAFLRQAKSERGELQNGYEQLAAILSGG